MINVKDFRVSKVRDSGVIFEDNKMRILFYKNDITIKNASNNVRYRLQRAGGSGGIDFSESGEVVNGEELFTFYDSDGGTITVPIEELLENEVIYDCINKRAVDSCRDRSRALGANEIEFKFKKIKVIDSLACKYLVSRKIESLVDEIVSKNVESKINAVLDRVNNSTTFNDEDISILKQLSKHI